jgi:hypothetical protein
MRNISSWRRAPQRPLIVLPGWIGLIERSKRAPQRRAEVFLTGVVLLALCCGGVNDLSAAPPRNDDCANAEVIPGNGPFPYMTAVVNINAATTTGDPTLLSCSDFVANSVWYTFTPVATAVYTVSTCSDAPTATTVRDTVMAIFTSSGGCPGATNEIMEACSSQGCADDSCGPGGLQAALTTTLLADTRYYIVVWRYDDDEPLEPDHTSLQLRVIKSVPANDTCLGAIPLLLDRPTKGSTAGAENNYQLDPIVCLTNSGAIASPALGPDVVYSFTAPSADDYSFKVINYSTTLVMGVRPDLVLYLLTNCPAGSGPITLNNCLAAVNRNRVISAEELVCVPLTAAQKVYLIVDQNGCTPGSSFTVEVTRCRRETEPNDSPATANALACGMTGAITGPDDADYFALGAPAAGSRAFIFLDGGAATVTDFNLRLVTATDTLEYDAQDNDEMFGSLSPNLAGTPLTGEETFVQVTGIGAEPYRLYAVVQPSLSSATPETEPNNTIGQANSADNNYYYGSLAGPAPSTDVDLYAFSAEAGDLIFLSLDGDPLRDNTPIDGQLELLDAEGNVLVTVNDGFNPVSPCSPSTLSRTDTDPANLNATTPFSPAEGLVYRTAVDATYYARVSIGTLCTQARGAGDYLLSISRNCPICCQLARFVEISRPDSGHTKLTLVGLPLTRYQFEATSDFSTWKSVGTGITDGTGHVEFEDATGSLTSRFYRASPSP